MARWTEYEGKTIDGEFPLNRLLRPEGTSAFFTTTKDGLPRIIRLIEAHSDQDEILSRWQAVDALDHPNILRLEDYGQVVVDDTTLLYAVMEPVDTSLGDIIATQRLTLEDTRQLAVSLLSVLEALHSDGFIHGHIEPAQVVAVHETVKLQCDSIRDAPEGPPGQELKKRDVQSLAAILLLALTQERTLDAATAQLPLPPPFDSIVKKGMSGEWGLAEISSALKISPELLHQVIAPGINAAPVTVAASPPQQIPLFAEDTAAELPPEELSTVDGSPSTVDGSPSTVGDSLSTVDDSLPAGDGDPREPQELPLQETQDDEAVLPLVRWIVGSLTIVLLLVLAITWRFLSSGKPVGNAQSAAISSQSPGRTQQPSSLPAQPAASSAASPTPPAPAVAGTQWRVIAYSYRRERRAQHKAHRIAHKHPALHPEVFRPGASGRYLVSVGGLLDREQAEALAKHLRRKGFPRSTRAQEFAPAGL